MVIKVCKTTEWSDRDWETYVIGYNEVFGADETIADFKNKYFSVCKGYSLHSLLVSNEGDVVGGITIIPCNYRCQQGFFLNGLAVDVFIREAFRIDPLMLRKLYKQLVGTLKEEGIEVVTAVPNATAYPYWKNIVKWKDIGEISYWVIPIKINKILNLKFCGWLFEGLTRIYLFCVLCLSYWVSLGKSKAKDYAYEIDKDDRYIQNKFHGTKYANFSVQAIFYSYRIVNEEGIKTAYIIEATQEGKRSMKAFLKVIKVIRQQNVDLIIYVGKMGVFQTLFIKVPKKLEPKKLPLMCDVLMPNDKFSDIYDINNWDFGLLNYDVR